jgi:hypothetical protein
VPEFENEKWIVRAALITVILVLCTTVTSFKIASSLATVNEEKASTVSRSAEFFAKNVRDHSFQLQMEVFELKKMLGSASPSVQKFIEGKVRDYDEAVDRFKKEQDKIEEEKQLILQEVDASRKHNRKLILAVIFLQVAIVMAIVSAFLRKKILWLSCLSVSLFGLVYMVNGFFLWF